MNVTLLSEGPCHLPQGIRKINNFSLQINKDGEKESPLLNGGGGVGVN